MNKIEQLQEQLNDATREVYEQYIKSGKCYDFSLMKEVKDTEICEDYYKELVEQDDCDDIIERITDNCPWCGDLLDDSYFNRDNCLCVGVMNYGDRAYATMYDLNNNEVWDMQIWNFIPDIAAKVMDLMSNQ